MLRKILMVLALVTSANLAVGVSYAAICRGSGGARACGQTCASTSSGNCGCTGSCTKAEMDWVAGAGSGDDEDPPLEEVVN